MECYSKSNKSLTTDLFSEDFGGRMEQYVEWGLKEAGLKYSNEKALRQTYAVTKVVDYFMHDDILVECKATELHPRAGVLRQADVMAKSLNTTIVKGYKQLLTTAAKIDPQRNWYGIIITYQEMYLGFGPDAWEEFLEKPMSDYCFENGISSRVLPPENLFFITIENWDYIVQIIKDKKASLKEILLKGQYCNGLSDVSERLMLMEQVLHKFFRIQNLTLSYLSQYSKFLNL